MKKQRSYLSTFYNKPTNSTFHLHFVILQHSKGYNSMHVFYSTDIEGQTILLEEDETKHALKVLRMEWGAAVQVLDGMGNLYQANLVEQVDKKAVLQINSQQSFSQHMPEIVIAIAPTKSSDRLEWMVEKATELGVDGIVPVICARSEKRKLNTDRLRKIVVSACKQSKNPWFPTVQEPMDIKKFLSISEPGLIAHCMDDTKREITQMPLAHQKQIIILIGPEGDFTTEELELALSKGWQPVSLGENRLRTETAGLFALSSILLQTRFP